MQKLLLILTLILIAKSSIAQNSFNSASTKKKAHNFATFTPFKYNSDIHLTLNRYHINKARDYPTCSNCYFNKSYTSFPSRSINNLGHLFRPTLNSYNSYNYSSMSAIDNGIYNNISLSGEEAAFGMIILAPFVIYETIKNSKQKETHYSTRIEQKR